MKGTGSSLRLQSLFHCWDVLSICADLGFQAQGKTAFVELPFSRGYFLLKHVARTKEGREDFQHQLIFLNDSGVKTTKVRFYCFSLAWILRFVLNFIFLKHDWNYRFIIKLAGLFIQIHFTCVGSTFCWIKRIREMTVLMVVLNFNKYSESMT